MKILKSNPITSFGGLNFVLNEFNNQKLSVLFNKYLPCLPAQSKYYWKDIFYSLWSVFFCGGDCTEDLSTNLKNVFDKNPMVKIPSPDRVLERMKELSKPKKSFVSPRGKVIHEFSFNERLNNLNLAILKKISSIGRQKNILDYDNTLIFTNKSDAAHTYMKRYGYCPGVGIIGNIVVYLENRNGNSDAQTLQDETMQRMFRLFKDNGIKIDVFRADGASYTLSTLSVVSRHVDKLFIRARMSESIEEAIVKINDWKEFKINNKTLLRGETIFIPFEKIAKRKKLEHLLKKYRLIITKEVRDDGQINLFTGEACNYHPIITNDFEMSGDQVVYFYNKRGATEREFDILKNDFGWNKMPFSKLEYNTVFLLLTAICRNIYHYIICKFSKIYKSLSPKFRIKKFIFRFICIPAKWIVTGRGYKLRIYGSVAFKT